LLLYALMADYIPFIHVMADLTVNTVEFIVASLIANKSFHIIQTGYHDSLDAVIVGDS
jgi:hypothetical protein